MEYKKTSIKIGSEISDDVVTVVGEKLFIKTQFKTVLLRGGFLVALTPGDSLKSINGAAKIGDKIFVAPVELYGKINNTKLIECLAAETAQAATTSLEQLGINTGLVVFIEEKKAQVGGIRKTSVSFLDRVIKSLPDRRIKVGAVEENLETPRRKRMAFIVGISLLVLLSVSIFFGIRRNRQEEIRSAYLPRLEKARFEFEEAKTLANINTSRARDLVLSARRGLSSLLAEEIADPEIDALYAQIQNELGGIAGIYEINPVQFLDLALIKEDFKGENLSFSGGDLRVLDTAKQRLVRVNLSSKKTEVIADSGDLFNAFSQTAYESKNYVLSRDGIREVGKEVALVIADEWDTKQILIGAFAGNFYVLDRENDLILRYPGIRSGFLESQEWLAPGIKPSLQGVKSWAIDGAIWLYYEDGDIDKYVSGVPESFEVQGLENKFEPESKIVSTEDGEYIYVFDRANSRIVAINKNGNYKAEYVSDSIKSATDFAVSEKEKKIILLDGSRLLEFELEHLG